MPLCRLGQKLFVQKNLLIPLDEEWEGTANVNALDPDKNLLHGVIHCNGYGHLLSIHGIQGGSKRLSGKELMNLWDRICSNLQVRKISLCDVAQKQETELRLLYGIAVGRPWFGQWGYMFLRGCFGVDKDQHSAAIKKFGSLQLDEMVQCFSEEICKNIKSIIDEYQGRSQSKLTTLQDLLKAMLFVQPRIKKASSKRRMFSSVAAKSKWPVKRLESTVEIITNILKENRATAFSGMNRVDLREAARVHVHTNALIDHVLKLLDNVIVGEFVVIRSVNPSTKVLHYSIEDVAPKTVYTDVRFVYRNAILSYSELKDLSSDLHSILNGKYLVKEWPFEDLKADLRFICELRPIDDDGRLSPLELPDAKGEVVILPLHATIGELKTSIQSTMRDTYCIMKNVTVTEIDNMPGLVDSTLLFDCSQSGQRLRFEGFGLGLKSRLIYEGGPLPWKVIKCKCGAVCDDGERMMLCDDCQIWHHKRCYDIADEDLKLVCDACKHL